MGKIRAAVVLFVDIDEEHVADATDLSYLIKWGLYQSGAVKKDDRLPVNLILPLTRAGKNFEVRIVNVTDLGTALGNGYTKTEPSAKSWRDKGIYTEKEQKQIDAEERWEEMGQ